MNLRYKDLKVTPGTYVPNVGIDYPEENPYERLHRPVYDRDVRVDEHYPFVETSLFWKIMNRLSYIFLLYIGLGLKLKFVFGIRYEGREWLRKYKKELAGGAITLGNHVYPIDCPAILIGVHAKHTHKIPMFAPNFSTKDHFFLRVVGGVPIPPAEMGLSAMKKFNEAFDEFHRRGYWFHIFPEAARWDFYKPLRPFQKGAFTMSYKYDMPLVPCVITYRERTGIYRLFGKKEIPLFTVKIGEPIFPDKTQPRKTEVDRLLHLAHERMEQMAGITHNTWPVEPEE